MLQIAEKLQICIMTHSDFSLRSKNLDSIKNKNKNKSKDPFEETKLPLDSCYDNISDRGKVYHTENTNENSKITEDDQMQTNCLQDNNNFESIMAELKSPMLPIRGAGLVHLSKLIMKKDHKIIKNMTQIEAIIQDNLNDSDSYVYLAAINALVALANIKPDLVLPRLCKEFINASDNSENGNYLSLKFSVIKSDMS